MREINTVIIHCSYTPANMDIGVPEIRRWHVEDNRWRDIGYHYVIRRSGILEVGRPIEQAGAHTLGQNQHSIGVCLVGGRATGSKPQCNFTPQQWDTLRDLVLELMAEHPNLRVHGHNYFTSEKTCPTFDVEAWAVGLR